MGILDLIARLQAQQKAGSATSATSRHGTGVPRKPRKNAGCTSATSATSVFDDSQDARPKEPERAPDECRTLPDPDTAESDRLEMLHEALTEKAGAFIGDGIEEREADRLAVVVVQCRTCAHHVPNRRNPEAGMATCAAGAWPLSRAAVGTDRLGFAPWPMADRYCNEWRAANGQA